MSTRYKRTNLVQRLEDYSFGSSTRFGFGQLLLTWLFTSLLASLAYAVPMTTNYQGYLENTESEPLNATVNMTFALYATAQGGNALWTETHQQIEVTDGVFSVTLGSQNSFTDDSLAGERYLGVTVGSDPEMTPRQPLTSAFFAMRAGVADSVKAASVETEAIADGAVTADKIADQTITGEQIAAGVTITAEERQKLENLGTGGLDNNPTFDNVTVEEQLNVKKRIKVGENSLYLGSPTPTSSDNSIWTDGGKHLVIQPPAKSNENVGIGTDTPKAKLDINGVLKVSPIDTSTLPLSFWKNFDDGLFTVYDSEKHEGEISSLNLIGSQQNWDYSQLVIMGDDVIINQQQEQGNLQPGNVGIGLKVEDEPKNQLDVAGSVAIGSSYAGKKIAPENGLLVEGKIGVGTSQNGASDPRYDVHLQNDNAKIAFGGNNTLEYAKNKGGANVLVGEYGTGDTDKLQLHGKKGIHFTTDNYQNGFKLEAMTILKNGKVQINGGTTKVFEEIHPYTGNKLEVNGDIHIDSDDHLRLGPWEIGQTGGGTQTSYLQIGRWSYDGSKNVPSTLVNVDWTGNVRARKFIKTSDVRLKKDIEPIDKPLEKVLNLKGVTFRFKEGSDENNPKEMGFIAQEVEAILPELVSTDEKGYKGVDYGAMTAVLVEAVKELKAQNEALKAIVCEDHPEKAICQ